MSLCCSMILQKFNNWKKLAIKPGKAQALKHSKLYVIEKFHFKLRSLSLPQETRTRRIISILCCMSSSWKGYYIKVTHHPKTEAKYDFVSCPSILTQLTTFSILLTLRFVAKLLFSAVIQKVLLQAHTINFFNTKTSSFEIYTKH